MSFNRKYPMLDVPQGNMAEYLLPAAMIGLLALGGLAWFSQGDNAQQALLKTVQGEHLSLGLNGQTALVSKQFGQNPNEQTLTLTLANGKRIQLQNVPVNLSVAIEVDGPNGTTLQILAALEQLISELEASGENPDMLNALKKLATSGYGLATQQRAIENKAAQCGADKFCMNSDGNADDPVKQAVYSMVLNACANEINSFCDKDKLFDLYRLTPVTASDWKTLKILSPGYQERLEKMGQFNFSSENVVMGSNVAKFIDAFRQVENNPSTSSAVNSLVSLMARQIFGISRLAANGFSKVGTSSSYQDIKAGQMNPLGSNLESTPDEYFQVVSESSRGIPSLFSHQTTTRSDVICATGKGSREHEVCR